MITNYQIYNCKDLHESYSVLLSPNNYDSNLLSKFNIIIENYTENTTQRNLKKLNKKFRKNCILIIFEDAKQEKVEILWKTSKVKNLLVLQFNKNYFSEVNKSFVKFVAEFLEACLSSGFLGVSDNQFDIHRRSFIQLYSISDARNKNLLHHACEIGNVSAVESLLKYGLNPDLSDVSLQNVAWQGLHSDVVLKLLNINLPFPDNIDINKCSEKLKNFINLSKEFHESIKCKNLERLEEILAQNPKLNYFYNLSNESALKTALDLKNIKIYEFLVSKNLKFSPHEDTDKIWGSLNLTDKEDLNTIHVKYLKDLPEKHINILLANTSLSHDENDEDGKMKLVQNAFRILNKEPKIKIILQIVAASKKFHIIFDFYRDSTYRIDPTTSAYTTGIFYFTGRILIGAKQLLEPTTEYEAFGTLAHELCHSAVNILYENKTNPYPQNDRQAKENFEKISQICKDKKDAEKIIKLVFEQYPKSQQHSELIVRPVHMMAHYMNQPEVLQEKREIFAELFNHFDNFIVPEMEKILPEIENRLAYKPTYIYSKLSEVNQKKVQNTFVKYKNIKIKMCELFSCVSVPYDKLTSDHIAQFLDNKILNFNDPHMHYLDKLVNFEWKTLSEKLKQKFLNSILNFQNFNIKFKNLENSCPNSFCALTSEQIIRVLSGDKLVVGGKFEPESEFYVDRKFMPEDGRQIFFEYEYGHEYVHDISIEDEHKRMRQTLLNKSFAEFYEDFLMLDLDKRIKILDKIKENYLYKIRYYDLSGDYIGYLHRSMSEIIQNTENEKLFILSSEAGAGKTVSFEHLTVEIKKQNSARWVSYIDLKDHTRLYIPFEKDFGDFFECLENVENLLKNILKLGTGVDFLGDGVDFLKFCGSNPASHTPNQPASQTPSHPATHTPYHPATHTSSHPASQTSNHPASHTPSHTPSHPTSQTTNYSASHTPYHNTSHTPSNPASHTTTHPASHTPTHPASQTPSHPTSQTPSHPASHTPTNPASHTPTHPASHTPTHPASQTLSHPASHTPYHDTSHPESHPASQTTTHPASHTPSHPATHTQYHPASHTPSHPLTPPKPPTTSNSDFESSIFSESFKSSNMVILWNGFDEISPTYNEFILTLIIFIYKNTKIIQYVCTRPLYSRQLFETFKIRPWQLVPFNEREKINFLDKFFTLKNIKVDLIERFILKVLEIVKKFEFQHKVFRDFNTPLLLKLIAEIHEDEKLFESANLYGIFETFVRKKVRIWIEKSEFARKTSENLIIKSSKFSIIEIFQKFAFFKEFKILSGTTLGLKIKKLHFMQKKIPKDLPFEEISRMGILYIDGENKFEFSHKTFGEFFIAQYFIENIYQADNDVNDDEAELRLEIFFRMSNEYGFLKIIFDFMNYYLKMDEIEDENWNLSETFAGLLRTKFKRFFMNLLSTNHPEIFEFLFEFFKRDHELLVQLLHVFEDETFYTAIYNPNYFSVAINPQNIKLLAQNYLTKNEFEQFLVGRNQNGKILTGIGFYGILGIFKDNCNVDFNLLAECFDFWTLIDEIKVKLTIEEQKQLFIMLASPKIYLYYNQRVFDFSDDFEVSFEFGGSKIQKIKSFFNNFKNFYPKNSKFDTKNSKIPESSKFDTKSSKFAPKSSKISENSKFDTKNSKFDTKSSKIPENSKFDSKSSKIPENSNSIQNASTSSHPSSSHSLSQAPYQTLSQITSNTPSHPTKPTQDNEKYQNLWTNFENLFTPTELQNIIGNALMDYLEIYGGRKTAGNFFLSILLNKTEKFLTNSQIFDMFLSKNIMHESCRGNFEVMWNFLCRHTTHDERKEILLQDNENDEKNFYFYYYANQEIKKNFSNYPFYYYYFDFTPFKVFHRIMTIPDAASFDFIKNIYLQHFRKTEIQKIILSSNDFLYYLIGRVLDGPCRQFVAFLEEIFDENKKLLKDYLDRKIKPTNLTVFQYLNDFRGTNEALYFQNLKFFENLYQKLSN